MFSFATLFLKQSGKAFCCRVFVMDDISVFFWRNPYLLSEFWRRGAMLW